MEHTLFVFLALLAGSLAGPIVDTTDSNTCATQCTASSKFSYKPGTTYDFQYDVNTRTEIQGASEDHSGLEMSAKVHMEFVSKCELVMRVTEVTLKEHDPSVSAMTDAPREFAEALERNPLRVSFQDGKVDDLCPADNEPTWILNVKRGILSTFQNNMDDLQTAKTVKETDVAGECEAEYTPGEKGWYSMVIKKNKNLMGCTGRHGYQTAIRGTAYRVPSEIQSLPLLKSSHDCEQEISSEGLLKTSTCKESHVFRPFSRNTSGAMTQHSQKLTYISEKAGVSRTESVTRRTSLLFEHTSETNSEENRRKDVERKLMALCQTTQQGVKPETARMFSDLVQTLKTVQSATLEQIYQKIKTGGICSENSQRTRKFFLDAIPMVGTISSLKTLTKLITSGDVSGVEAEMWLTSLAFIQNPTQDMLTEVKPLLISETLQGKAMLSVSTLINSYCRLHGNCDSNPEVASILRILEGKLEPGCRVNRSNFKQILMALRAIGNAGHVQSIVPTLNSCFEMADNPVEVRLSAIEAFRRMSCDADKSQVMALFRNHEEDSELRITAYRAIMECPTAEVLQQVQMTLESEEVNQVGSYIWSHLTNLMETSDPHKQEIRAILENQTLKKEFNMDQRKYSRNYEGSMFFERLNTGVKAEGDLIWSSKSFIPRSAMANLTVDLFGHSVNLFEIGGRIEGLEYLLESYFGPNGYFSDSNDDEPSTDVAIKGVGSDKMDKINKRFGKGMDELRGAMYLRMFGNELNYMNFEGLDALTGGESFNILDMILKLASNNDFTYTQSSMFLDSSIIVPTSVGFPLTVQFNGTATIDLKASGKVDIRKIMSGTPTMDINGLIQPSASIELSSQMITDAFVTKAGLKTVTTIHSSTAVQGRIQLEDGQVFSAEWDTPQEQMDIISVKNEMYIVHRDQERQQQMITENRQVKRACTGDKMAKITGLELCGEIQFPNASLKADAPYFPMTGPSSVALTLNKQDTHTGYKLEARSIHTNRGNLVRLAFTTPESRVDRTFSAELNLNRKDGTFDMGFASPWKKADFKGTLVNKLKAKGIMGKLQMDNKLQYVLDANVKQQVSGTTVKYVPTLELRMPGKDDVTINGIISYKAMTVLDIEMNANGIMESPIIAKATVNKKPVLQGVSASINLGKGDYSVNARLQKSQTKKKTNYEPLISVRSPTTELMLVGGSIGLISGKQIKFDLAMDKIVAKKVTLKGAIVKNFNAKKKRMMLATKLDFKSSPMDVKLKSKMDNRGWKTIATNMDLTYIIRRYAKNSIKFVSKISDLSTKSLTKGKWNAALEMKNNPDLNFKMTGNLNHNYKHSEIDVDLQYGSDPKDNQKHLEVSAMMNRLNKNWADMSMDYDARIRHLGQGVNILLKGSHKHDRRDLDSSHTVSFSQQNTLSTKLRLRDQTKALVSITGEFELIFPGQNIHLGATLKQPSENKFVNTLNVQLGKGKKNSIITTWNSPNKGEYEVSTDIQTQLMKPLRFDTALNIQSDQFRASALTQYGQTRYGTTLSGEMRKGAFLRMTTDIEYPSRHIIATIEDLREGYMCSSKMDIRWDADGDATQRITLENKLIFESLQNWNETVTLQYPSRTLSMNARHQGGARYESHAHLQWAPDSTITIDSTVVNRITKRGKNVLATLNLRTPFTNISSFDAEFNRRSDNVEESTSLDTALNGNKMSGTLSIQKPFSLQNMILKFVAKTPFEQTKNVKANIAHKFSDSLSTSGKFTWNQNNIQVDITAKNKGNNQTTNLQGQIDVKTSFPALRTASVIVSHKFNDQTLGNSAEAQLNGKQYKVETEVTHSRTGWQVQNNGQFTLTIPENSMRAVWTHSNTQSELTSSAKANWGTNSRMFVEFTGRQAMSLPQGSISSSLRIETPFALVRHIAAEMNHEHREGFIESNMNLKKDEIQVAHTDFSYRRENGQASLSFAMTNPIQEGDVTMKLNSAYDNFPYSGHIEMGISPSERIVIDGTLVKNQDNVEATITLSTPFDGLTSLTFKGKQTKERQDFVHEGSVEYAPGKTIVIETRSRYDSTKKLSIVMTTPFQNFSNFETEFTLRATKNTFTAASSIEIRPIFGRWSTSASWSTRDGVTASARINTPLRKFPYAQAVFENGMRGQSRASAIEIEYLPNKVVKLETLYNLNDIRSLEANAKITTPFAAMPYFGAGFSHANNDGTYTSSAEIEYQPGKKISTNANLSLKSAVQGSLAFTSPFTDDMSMSFSHAGSMQDFQTNTAVEIGKTKRYATDVKFSSVDSITGEVTIKTPYEGWKKIRAAMTHDGSMKDFQTSGQISFGPGKIYLASVNFQSEPKVSAAVSLQTPIEGFESIKATGVYTGVFPDVTANIGMALGENTLGGEVVISMNPKFSIDASMKSTYDVLPNVRTIITHEGTWRRFASHAEVSHEALGDMSADVKINTYSGLAADISLTTPVRGFETINAAIAHNGSFSGFQSHAEVTYGRGKSFSGDIKFTTKPSLMLEATLSTPFKAVRLSKLVLTHAGTIKNFKSHAEFVMNKDKTMADLSLKSGKKIDFDLSIRSPYLDPIKVSIDHSGSFKKFSTKMRSNYGKKAMTTTIKFRTVPGLNAIINIKTPFLKIKKRQFTLKHTGDSKSFKINSQYVYNKNKITGDVSFQNDGNTAGSLKIKSPFFNPILASFDFNGTPMNFRSAADVTYSSKKSISLNYKLNAEKGFSTSLAFTSPFSGFEKINAAVTQRGQLNNFQCQALVKYLGKKVQLDAALDYRRDIIASATFVSPFRGFEDISLTFNHAGGRNNFNTHALFTGRGKKIEGDILFANTDILTGSTSFKSTGMGLNNFEGSFRHEGKPTNFKSHIDFTYGGNRHGADIIFDIENKTEGRLSMSSPFFKDITAEFEHTGPISNFNSRAQAMYGGNRLMNIVGKLDTNVRVTGDLSINLPTESVKNTRITFQHDGDLNNFQSEVQFNFMKTRSTGDISFTTSPFPQGQINLDTPLSKPVKAAFEFNGKVSNFKSHAEMSYGKQNVFDITTSANTDGPISAELRLLTQVLKPISAEINHDGEFGSFRSHAEFSYGDDKNEADAAFRTEPNMEGSLNIKSPFFKQVDVQFNQEGPLTNARAQAGLSYGKQELLDFTGTIDVRGPMSGDMVLTLPAFETIRVGFTHEGSINAFRCHGEVTYGTKKTEADIGFSNKASTSGSINIRSPYFEIVDYKFDHAMGTSNMRTSSELTYGKQVLLDVSGTINTVQPVSFDVTLETPLLKRLHADFTYEGISTSFRSTANIMYGEEKAEGSLNLKLQPNVEGTLSVKTTQFEDIDMEWNVQVRDMQADASLSYGEVSLFKLRSNIDVTRNIVGSVKLELPLQGYETNKVSFRSRGSLSNFNTNIGLTIKNTRHTIDAAFDMENNYGASLEISSPLVEFTKVALNIEGSIKRSHSHFEAQYGSQKSEMDFTLALNGHIEGKLSIASPFTQDISSSFEFTRSNNSLNIKSELSYGVQRGQAVVSMNFQPTASFSFSLSTPFKGYEQTQLSLTHEGSVTNFRTHIEADVSATHYESDIKFILDDGLDTDMSIKSSLFSDIYTFIKYKKEGTTYSYSDDLTYDGESLGSIAGTITVDDVKSGELNINMPFTGYDRLRISFRHEGELTNFKTHADASIGDSRAEIATEFTMTSDIAATLIVKTPIYPEMNINISLSGSKMNNNGNIQLTYGDINVIDGSYNFRGLSPLSIDFSVKTMATEYRNIAGNLNFNGDVTQFNFHAEGNIQDAALTAVLTTAYTGEDFRSTLSLTTPFEGFENINSQIHHSFNDKTVMEHFELQFGPDYMYEFDSSLTWKIPIQGSIRVRTPINQWRESQASFTFEGNAVNFESRGEVVFYKGTFAYDSVLNLQGPINIKLSLRSPLEGMEKFDIIVNADGDWNSANAGVGIVAGSQKLIDARFRHRMVGNKVQCKLVISNVYTEDIVLSADFEGESTSFLSTTEASIGTDNSVTMETTFNIGTNVIAFRSLLSATLSGETRSAEVSFNHDGPLNNFQTSASAKYMGRAITGLMKFHMTPSLEGSLEIETPFTNFRDLSASFQHTGKRQGFSSFGQIKYLNDKTIEGKIDFSSGNWRRVSVSSELKTPYENFEMTQMSYSHSIVPSSAEIDASITCASDKTVRIGLRGSKAPHSISATVNTPFEGLEEFGVKGNFAMNDWAYNTEATAFYGQGAQIVIASDANLNDSPKTINVRFTTPFAGLESNEFRSTFSGSLLNFQSTVSLESPITTPINTRVNFRFISLMDMDAAATFTSELKGIENLQVTIANTDYRSKSRSKIEASWGLQKTITFDGSFMNRGNGKILGSEVTITSPFKALRMINMNMAHKATGKMYKELFSAVYNGEKLVDIGAEYHMGSRRVGILSMKAPQPMKAEISSQLESDRVEADISLDWNTDISGSTVRVETLYSQLTGKLLSVKVIRPTRTWFLQSSYENSQNRLSSRSEFSWGDISTERIGYSIDIAEEDYDVKIILPSRSLEMTGSQKYSGNMATTEGFFLWDADRDQSQKIGFKSVIVPQTEAMKADLTLMMPSIGKDVQLGSEMVLGNGRIIFDGKTELTYSSNKQKTLTLYSRIEDISTSYSGKNYSLVFGVSHPFTTVDVQIKSHVGSDDEKYSAGVEIMYLTARRHTQTFVMNGELNKLRHDASVQVRTPLKNLELSGDIKMTSPYKVSVRNVCDNSDPISAVLTLDPGEKMVDLQMNYDLENPSSTFRVNAKYVNSSAILGEMSHVTNGRRMTDGLMFLRLNTSRLLHARIHWRPQMLLDMPTFAERKTTMYGNRFAVSLIEAQKAIHTELMEKYRLIRESVTEDAEPYSNAIQEELTYLKDNMDRMMVEMNRMYDENEYYVRDISNVIDVTVDEISVRYNEMEQTMEEYADRVIISGKEMMGTAEEKMWKNYMDLLEMTSAKMEELTECLTEYYTQMQKQYQLHSNNIAETLYNMTMHPTVQNLTLKYQRYLHQLRNYPVREHFNSLKDMDMSAIYNIRERINTHISNLLGRDDLQYFKNVANGVYWQGKNAYKYWEIEENMEALFRELYRIVKLSIEEELNKVKQIVTALDKPNVTVYDPAHGEIQVDLRLPIPLKNLQEVPVVDVTSHVNRLKSYIPRDLSMPKLIPDTTEMMPPFDAVAKISEGNHFITFDGREYDFSGRCTYVLARDYVDANFTIMLRNGEKRAVIAVVNGKAFELLAAGLVRVNGEPQTLPYLSDNVMITSEGNVTKMDGARSFEVEYNNKTDVFTVGINGWYYGKTGGLLGSYDNEPHNDFMNSYNKPVDEVNRFAKSWEVGSAKCR